MEDIDLDDWEVVDVEMQKPGVVFRLARDTFTAEELGGIFLEAKARGMKMSEYIGDCVRRRLHEPYPRTEASSVTIH